MKSSNKDFNEKLKKHILRNRQVAAVVLLGRKHKLDERIDFNKLNADIEKRLETPIIDDTITEHFYNELNTLSSFFIEYNKNVKKLAKIEYELYQSCSYKIEHFEYAETMIVEKALANYSAKVNSFTNGESAAYGEVKAMIDSCRYANIKNKQTEKTMWWFFLLYDNIDFSFVLW